MTSIKPPSGVISAIESGEAEITRRVDIYESDGVTPWYPGDSEDPRLIDGTITVDSARSERRGFDVNLDNQDNALRPEPNQGLWYDKIIKPYRGVKVNGRLIQPKILVAYALSNAVAMEAKGLLLSLGYTNVSTHVGAIGSLTLQDAAVYDMIFVYRKADITATWDNAILEGMFDLGKGVFLQSPGITASNTPRMFSAVAAGPQGFAYEPIPGDNPVKGTWTTDNTYSATLAGTARLTTLAAGVRAAARKPSTTDIMAATLVNNVGGRWFAFAPPGFGSPNALNLLSNATKWVANQSDIYEWETKLGEYMIDKISEKSRPYVTQVTGRDYVKKCLVSKLQTTMSFDPEVPVSTFVKALAANAGVTKFNLPDTPETIGTGMVFDRTTERWSAMEKACDANNYELFFDLNGALTMRPYYDPVTSPFSTTFQTGSDGNLVEWDRSVNDSRLYNHIIVTGDSGEEGVPPYFGEARNEEPSSPTRISRIGDRSYFYTSSFFTSDAQCEALALRWLKEKALESYEISWSSINYPWLEVGEIVEFLDPRRYDYEPTRFLMDTLSIPMGLGPMSATGKRVTFVTDPDLVI